MKLQSEADQIRILFSTQGFYYLMLITILSFSFKCFASSQLPFTSLYHRYLVSQTLWNTVLKKIWFHQEKERLVNLLSFTLSFVLLKVQVLA